MMPVQKDMAVHQIFLELTNHCNFSCSFCAEEAMQRERGFMDEQLASRLLKEISQEKLASRVLFHVMGEPLLHPRLVDILEHARRLGLSSVVYTNGSLLSGERGAALLESGLSELVISLHSKGPQDHKLRNAAGIGYEDYLRHICEFIRTRYSMPSEMTIRVEIMNTLGSSYGIVDTEVDILNFILSWADFLRELGSDPVDKPAKTFLASFRNRQYAEHRLLDNFVIGLKPVGEWVDARRIAAVKEDGVVAFEGECPALQTHFAILWNGDFTVCCSDYDGMNVLGNVTNISLREFWTKRRVQNLRADFQSGFLGLPYCLVCHSVPKSRAIRTGEASWKLENHLRQGHNIKCRVR